MMRRPVIKKEVLDYLRQQQNLGISKSTLAIKKTAVENNVPIIPEETVVFFKFLFSQVKVKNLLEVGTAYGYSASMFYDFLPDDAQITTIDRFDLMIEKATNHFSKYNLNDKIQLLQGQAGEILLDLEDNSYDCIFLDCAKSKYIEFLPICLDLLTTKGMIIIDDVFQGGTVFDNDETIPRGKRKIHKRLKQLLDLTAKDQGITSCLLPLGDGLLLITKEEDYKTLNLNFEDK